MAIKKYSHYYENKMQTFQKYFNNIQSVFQKNWKELCSYFGGGTVELGLKSSQSEAPNGHQEGVSGHPEEEKVFGFFYWRFKR